MSRRTLAFVVLTLVVVVAAALRRRVRRRADGHRHGSPDHWPEVARKPDA